MFFTLNVLPHLNKYANKLYRRPTNQYESDSSMTNKVDCTKLMLLVFLDLKK